MSETKPVKCSVTSNAWKYPEINVNNKLLREAVNSNGDPQVLLSYKCPDDGEAAIPFTFRGRVHPDHGRFEGPGKLRLRPRDYDISDDKHDGVCLRPGLVRGHQEIAEVVGTFKDGTPIGLVKITLRDGSIVIASLNNNGAYLGLRRDWNAEGNLESVGFWNKWPRGKPWTKIGHFLVVRDLSMILEQEPQPDILLHLEKADEIFVGKYHPHLGIFEVEQKVLEFDVVGNALKDCLLDVNVVKSEPEKKMLHLATGMHVENPIENCNLGTASTNPEDRFASWKSEMISNYGEDQGYKLLLEQTPTTSEIRGQEDMPESRLFNNLKLINADSLRFTTSMWNSSRISEIQMTRGQLDSSGQPHGDCEIKILTMPDKHYLLDWQPLKVEGYFKNGNLEGIAKITLMKNSLLWVTFKNGTLHGRAFAYGLYPIYEVNSNFCFAQFHRKNNINYFFSRGITRWNR